MTGPRTSPFIAFTTFYAKQALTARDFFLDFLCIAPWSDYSRAAKVWTLIRNGFREGFEQFDDVGS